MSVMSRSAGARLRNYAECHGPGETIESDWTLYPENTTTMVKVLLSLVPNSGYLIAIFFAMEAINPCPSTLGLVKEFGSLDHTV